jgi:hypothetical protein
MAVLSLGVLVIMAIIYVLLFLSLSGALKKITSRQWSSTGGANSSKDGDFTLSDPSSVAATRRREVRAVARRMLWFVLGAKMTAGSS